MDANSQTLQVPPWLSFTMASKVCTQANADDTHVTVTSKNVEELAHKAPEELAHISEYMRLNKLSANPQKTGYMIIGHPRRTTPLKFKKGIPSFNVFRTEPCP